jgi:biotin carboxyl carrier protein
VTFEIEVNGRVRAVSVERLAESHHAGAPQRFRIIVDGTPHLVDAVRVDSGALSLILADEPATVRDAQRRSHHVAITEGAPGDLTLTMAEGLVRAVVNGRRARRGADAASLTGVQRVLAPMPGKVLRVLVKPGDEVALRQPLVVVEAMKMENELSSPKAGRVKEVAAVEGQSVEAGRLLVVVE